MSAVTQTDPTLGRNEGLQTDPLSTAGKTGRKSLCLDHNVVIRTKVEAGLSAQRIYQDLTTEIGFEGSYQAVKRYVAKLRLAESQVD